MFRKKTWVEVSRRFSPPVTHSHSLSGDFDTYVYMKLVFGFTTIELQCTETGELKFYEEIGDQTK